MTIQKAFNSHMKKIIAN